MSTSPSTRPIPAFAVTPCKRSYRIFLFGYSVCLGQQVSREMGGGRGTSAGGRESPNSAPASRGQCTDGPGPAPLCEGAIPDRNPETMKDLKEPENTFRPVHKADAANVRNESTRNKKGREVVILFHTVCRVFWIKIVEGCYLPTLLFFNLTLRSFIHKLRLFVDIFCKNKLILN